MHKIFYSAQLKKKVDPDIFITHLEDVQTRMEIMGSKMTDEQFMMHILNNLTSDYMMDISKLKDRIGSKDNPLDIEDMREALSLTFERMNDGANNDSDEEETALAAGQFKGRCNACGKYGHKSADCRSKGKSGQGNSSTSGGFKGDCNYCKKTGHKEVDCYKKKRDNGEQANLSVKKKKKKDKDDDDEDQAEMVFMAVEKEEDKEQDFVCLDYEGNFVILDYEGNSNGEPYLKMYSTQHADRSLKSWKTRIVSDILPAQNDAEEMAFSVTDEEQEEDETAKDKLFLSQVAYEKNIKPADSESWIDSVQNKLTDIGILTEH
jgi:hypothetical protein